VPPKLTSPALKLSASFRFLFKISEGFVYSKVRYNIVNNFHNLNGEGIYPREPRNKQKVRKGATPSTTFYYAKDIQYLQHEPLLHKFRDHKALAKKIGRALGRNEANDAARLERSEPRMTLDHLIKERYPTFIDALRDMDDALSMLFLFASLPSTSHVPPKTIALCQRLCLEFQHYLIVSRSLRKSFLSIKGIYYQATIHGQDIMWLVPYKFVQKMAGDIDFRIMGTFIEFYTTLLGFVNYRLYTTLGLVYPPKFNSASDEQGGELGAYTLEGRLISTQQTIANGDGKMEEDQNLMENGVNGHTKDNAISTEAQAEADKLALLPIAEEEAENKEENDPDAGLAEEAIDNFQIAATQDADILPQPQYTDPQAFDVFSDFTFFLSRETPKTSLEFILKAFGCKKVGWHAVLGDSAFTTDESDTRITHQVVDRPPYIPVEHQSDSEDSVYELDTSIQAAQPVATSRVPGRTYVQPQWVWDCINQGRLLRPDLYAPGATLPPHLSPWVKPKSSAYDPTVPLVVQEKEGEAEEAEAEAALEAINGPEEVYEEAEESSEAEYTNSVAASENANGDVLPGEGMIVDDGSEDEANDNEEVDDEWGGLSEQDDDDVSDGAQERDQYQRELEAEATGKPFSAESARNVDKLNEMKRKKAVKERQVREELDRQRMMMPNKKRKLFDKMQYGNKKREAEAEKLRKKRRKIERGLMAKAVS
jgi:pescadillo